MFGIRDKRIRIVLAAVLLAVIGVAVYQTVLAYLTGRHYAAACAALERYDYEPAATHLKNYLSLRPSDPEILLMAAQTDRRRGKLDEAFRTLRLAEQHGATTESVEMELNLLGIQGGNPAGVEKLLRFCDDHPDGPQAAICLEAIIEGALRVGNPVVAARCVSLWLKHRPSPIDQAQGLYWRGRVKTFDLNEHVKAEDDFRQALELAPDLYIARVWLVEGMIEQSTAEALPHLEILRRQRPNDPRVVFQTARVYRNLGRAEESADMLDELLATRPNWVDALVERGGIEIDLKRPLEGELWLRRAVSLDPNDRDANAAMARCLTQSGRHNDAKPFQDKIREFDLGQEKMKEEAKKRKGPA